MKSVVLAGTALLAFFSADICKPETSTIGWPEVIDNLAKERSLAVICGGLIKSRAGPEVVTNAELTYGIAKAEMDGVIAGLKTAIVQGSTPDKLPTVQSSLNESGNALTTICDAAAKAGDASNTKGVWDDIIRGAVEPVVTAVSAGIGAVWNRRIKMTDLEIEAIKSEPEFSGLAAK